MNTWIALFRGINVGGHGKLPMKELVALLEGLGCAEVRTYIQSGNVVFRHDSVAGLTDAIPAAVEDRCGFAPRVQLLAAAEFEKAIVACPYDLAEGKAVHFFFLDEEPADPDLAKIESLKAPSESWHLEGRVFYLHAPDGIGRSKLAGRVEKCLGVEGTGRNGNTVARVAAMAAD